MRAGPRDARFVGGEKDSGNRLYTVNRPGALAQLGERLLCKQEVTGSIPVGSTTICSSQSIAKRPLADILRFIVRLLFKNSEEVKRIRFSQTGFVWV